MDGIALALRVARDYPGLKVLLMSGQPELASEEIAARVGRVLAKPSDAGRIVFEVSAALAA